MAATIAAPVAAENSIYCIIVRVNVFACVRYTHIETCLHEHLNCVQ